MNKKHNKKHLTNFKFTKTCLRKPTNFKNYTFSVKYPSLTLTLKVKLARQK